MGKKVDDKIITDLMEKADGYSYEAAKYLKLFMIASGLLDLYVPIPNGISWSSFIIANDEMLNDKKYS